MWAYLIHGQCRNTQEFFIDASSGPKALAQRLDFLMAYYDGNCKRLAGSQLGPIIWREYQQTLTNAVVAFRAASTNDLGADPRAWIEKYKR
jgi:hypothetical protein